MGKYEHLTDEEAEFFLEHGYLVVKHAFSRAKADAFTRDLWVRLGLDAHAPERWDRERVHMPVHVREPVASFAPKVWEIIKELLGGEDRIDAASSTWGDSFIVNLGPPSPSPSPSSPPPTQSLFESGHGPSGPRALTNWHVDGDFFVHFLDSPEQALLVTPLFSPIAPRGGATYIAPRSVPRVARYLARHPEGVVAANLSFIPASSVYARPGARALTAEELERAKAECGPDGVWSHLEQAGEMEDFVELTGEVGDVVLMHPFMMHSASRNERWGTARVITNPPVALKEPFCFARGEGEGEYSLVERATLRALGVDRFEFKIEGERRSVVPARVAKQAALLEEEKRRIEEARRKADAAVDTTAAVAIAVA